MIMFWIGMILRLEWKYQVAAGKAGLLWQTCCQMAIDA